MVQLKKKKKQNNSSFILSVCLMLALIVGLMVPTAVAWFTDSDTGSSNTPINFGTVDINVEQNADTSAKVEFINLNSSARALNAVLPGDSIEFSFNVINTGNVDTYAKVNFAPKIMYGETDITPLLYDTTTDPVNQPYWIVDNTNITTDNPDFYTGGDQNNQVFVLETGETKQIKGVLQFSTKLPNSVTDGITTYKLNGHEETIKLVLDINMAGIQKDNNNLETAITELNDYVDSMAINYSFTYLNGAPTLLVAGKPVQTSECYTVNASEDTKAYAFISEVDGEKTLLAVVGEGEMNNYTSTTQPWKDTRSNITEVTIEDGITNIGNYAFYGCKNLTSVTIPNSVTTIGSSAFYGCSSLTNITIPNSVTSIGNSALNNCSGLESIAVENNNPVYKSEDNCLIEIASNTLILGCKNSIIPNDVTTIGSNAFDSCIDLTSITIPNSVTTINSNAFYGCRNLTSVTIPDSVTYIGEYAFTICNLTSIIIPNSITYIGERAFSGCNSLTNITIPNSITTIETNTFNACKNLTNVILSNGLITIGNAAFYNCPNLTSIIIPNSVTTIEAHSFRKCTKLTNVIIPESVTKIGLYAFEGCTDLTRIYMVHPSSDGISLGGLWIPKTTTVYYYSTTPKSGYWHYATDGVTPVLW